VEARVSKWEETQRSLALVLSFWLAGEKENIRDLRKGPGMGRDFGNALNSRKQEKTYVYYKRSRRKRLWAN